MGWMLEKIDREGVKGGPLRRLVFGIRSRTDQLGRAELSSKVWLQGIWLIYLPTHLFGPE